MGVHIDTNIGVCFHRPQSENGLKKKQLVNNWSKCWKGIDYTIILCFIYSYHVLYFMPCVIYLCQFQHMFHYFSFMLHQDSPFCCIVFSLIYVVSTQINAASTQQFNVVSRVVSSSTFSITPYSEKLSIAWSSLWSYLPYRIWNNKAYCCTSTCGALWCSHRVSA